MSAYTFPASDYDSPKTLLRLLGSFWSETYPDSLVEDLMSAYALGARQTHADMRELVAACSRFDVPIYHQEQWYRLVLKQSEHNTDPATARSVYGGGAVYGPQPTTGEQLKYGQPWFPYSVFPLPTDLVSCPFIFNRITQPSVSLLNGLDFVIDIERDALIFRDNPFDNELVSVRNVYDSSGNIVDKEACLWLFRPRFEREDVFTQFGYPLKFYVGESSRSYRDAVNGAWDNLVRGSSSLDLRKTIAAICDVPLAAGTETVEVIIKDNRNLIIATDANVYRFHSDATPLVSVGDTVHAGDALTNTLQFYEFHRGEYGDLPAITLGPGFLPGGYYDSITFYNKSVPLSVDTSGIFTYVSFEVGGWPGDVEKFWEDFHTNGVANGQTLAHLLDQRTNKVGEPQASNLPATVNPLEFVVENVLRNNAFLVRIVYNHRGTSALSLETMSRQLRRLSIPSVGMLVMVELAAPAETATLTGYSSESASPYLGSEPFSESHDLSSATSESLAIRYIDGHCI